VERIPATLVNVEPRGLILTTGRVVRTLKDGYWDRTEVVELGDGSRRVRKSAKGLAAYKATKTAAKKAPAPVKALPVVAGVGAAGAAGAVAARRKRQQHKEPAPV